MKPKVRDLMDERILVFVVSRNHHLYGFFTEFSKDGGPTAVEEGRAVRVARSLDPARMDRRFE